MAKGERPLAKRQEHVLVAFLDHEDEKGRGAAMIGNDIGYALGLDRHRARRLSGPWSGQMGAAQRVISSITGLRRRGLLRHAPRPSGLSGGADALTEEGRRVARELRAAGVPAREQL